ncbi:Phage tail sheath protein beta-sandwich domain [Popillia japonica]|uniref:Phage tail sheath protein beta-sandwich domain n=1 Tax=Popillia japonica TaxID=7064 RepID=A0AAW1HSS1_POPJA
MTVGDRGIGIAQPSMTVGDRGIGTMAIPLSWGAEGELIEVLSTDLTTGASLATVGVTAFDDGAKLLNLMLSNCYKALVYRLNTGGVKATGTGGALTVTAKYAGTLGNAITVTITETDGVFTVVTWVSGASRDSQPVTTISELADNDFVAFSGSGDLTINAGITLAGGTDGSYTASTAYPVYLELASRANWQTMALTQDNDAYASQFVTFADTLRNSEGKYSQVVVANYDADNYGVIKVNQGLVVDGVTLTAEDKG